MQASVAPKYRYHARAAAVSGKVTRPVQLAFDDKTELPKWAGGYLRKPIDPPDSNGIFSFSAAYTLVTGSEGPDGNFNTLSIATIEKLNVLDIVKADRITARLVGLHCKNDFGECPRPWIIPLGSTIEGLKIAGHDFQFSYPDGFHLDPKNPPGYERWKANKPDYATQGHSMHVPRFGTVTVCRLYVERENDSEDGKPHMVHRLRMLSINLGSPVEGTLEFGGSDQNGSPP